MARVLTRSEGGEIHCFAIEPDGEYARVLHLISDWSIPLEGTRYVVNCRILDRAKGEYVERGERWRPVNPASPWGRDCQSFDEAVEYYKCEDPWDAESDGPIKESESEIIEEKYPR